MLQCINDCIKGICIEESDVKYEISSTSDDFDYDEVPSTWQSWSDEIYVKANTLALNSHNGNIVNAFYNPKAAQKLKSLIKHLPLWTGIMRPYFNAGTEIATSSSVESIFAEYKSGLFKGCIPMRVDKFVVNHLNYIDGRIRLDFAQQELKMSVDSNVQKSGHRSDSFNDTSLVNSTPIHENVHDTANTDSTHSIPNVNYDEPYCTIYRTHLKIR